MSVTNNIVGATSVKIAEVAELLGVKANTVSVCTSAAINKWSHQKPVRSNAITLPYPMTAKSGRDNTSTMTVEKHMHWGMACPLHALASSNIYLGAVGGILDKMSTDVGYRAAYNWTYLPPLATGPKRLGDFRGYQHGSYDTPWEVGIVGMDTVEDTVFVNLFDYTDITFYCRNRFIGSSNVNLTDLFGADTAQYYFYVEEWQVTDSTRTLLNTYFAAHPLTTYETHRITINPQTNGGQRLYVFGFAKKGNNNAPADAILSIYEGNGGSIARTLAYQYGCSRITWRPMLRWKSHGTYTAYTDSWDTSNPSSANGSSGWMWVKVEKTDVAFNIINPLGSYSPTILGQRNYILAYETYKLPNNGGAMAVSGKQTDLHCSDNDTSDAYAINWIVTIPARETRDEAKTEYFDLYIYLPSLATDAHTTKLCNLFIKRHGDADSLFTNFAGLTSVNIMY